MNACTFALQSLFHIDLFREGVLLRLIDPDTRLLDYQNWRKGGAKGARTFGADPAISNRSNWKVEVKQVLAETREFVQNGFPPELRSVFRVATFCGACQCGPSSRARINLLSAWRALLCSLDAVTNSAIFWWTEIICAEEAPIKQAVKKLLKK